MFERKVGFTLWAGFPALAIAVGVWIDSILVRPARDAQRTEKLPTEVSAVAQRALGRFAWPTFHYQRLAFGKAADRHVCRKGRPRVAAFETE